MTRSNSEPSDKAADTLPPVKEKGARGVSPLGRLYEKYQREFTVFAYRHYNIEEEDAAEIFQESFIAFYHNLSSGRLRKLTCSLRTYLFRTGEYKILNERRRETPLSFTDLTTLMENHYSNEQGWDERQQLVYDTVCAMKEPCNKVLTMYYSERMSMQEIARAMDYDTEQVAKNRKGLCVKKLRENIALKENE